jgi:hypothetical protein
MKKCEHLVTLSSGEDSAVDQRNQLSLERVVQIRVRIRSGAYNTAAVIDAVARGITRSDDP